MQGARVDGPPADTACPYSLTDSGSAADHGRCGSAPQADGVDRFAGRTGGGGCPTACGGERRDDPCLQAGRLAGPLWYRSRARPLIGTDGGADQFSCRAGLPSGALRNRYPGTALPCVSSLPDDGIEPILFIASAIGLLAAAVAFFLSTWEVLKNLFNMIVTAVALASYIVALIDFANIIKGV